MNNRFIVIAILVAASSCRPAYVPIRENVPLLAEKYDASGAASFSDVLNLQFAFSPTNHIGVLFNGSRANRFSTTLEGGLGLYHKINESNVIEAYAGFGKGKLRITEPNENSVQIRVAGWNRHYFFQVNDGGKVGKRLEGILSGRLTLVDMYKYEKSEKGEDDDQFNLVDSGKRKLTYYFEPAVTSKLTITKNVKLALQLGASLPLKNHKGYSNEKIFGSIGIELCRSGLSK